MKNEKPIVPSLMLGLFALALAALAGIAGTARPVHAQVTQAMYETLPVSDEDQSTIMLSTCANIRVIALSTNTPTQLDTTLNSDLSTMLGANYHRYTVQFQNDTSTPSYIGYSGIAVSTAGMFQVAPLSRPWSFKLGKAVHLYGLGANGTTGANLKVGGCGWKR